MKLKNPTSISIRSECATLESLNCDGTGPLDANIEQPSFQGICLESWQTSC